MIEKILFKNNLAYLLLIMAIINNSAGNVLIKLSSSAVESGKGFNLYISPIFILGVGFFGLNILFYAKSLRFIPLSSAYPILAGGSFVLTTLAGHIIYGEIASIAKVMGILLITVGIMLLLNSSSNCCSNLLHIFRQPYRPERKGVCTVKL